MTRVLVLDGSLPSPTGNGHVPAQRTAQLCRELVANGIDVCALVADAAPFYGIGCRTEVATVPVTAREKLRAFIHGPHAAWAAAARTRAECLAREHRAGAVLVATPPYGVTDLAHMLRARLGIPYVVDLRDAWVLDGRRRHRTGFGMKRDMARMRGALRSAAAVLATVPEAAKEYARLGAVHVAVVPNGFTPARVHAPAPQDGTEHFHVAHCGGFRTISERLGFTEQAPGDRRARCIEPLGDSLFPLLQGLGLLRQKVPAVFARVRLHLPAELHASERDVVEWLAIEDAIVEPGKHGHRTASQADVVHTSMHNVPAGERALAAPLALLPSLASGRPVLAALPAGDAADLVRVLHCGTLVAACDAPALCRALEQFAGARAQGGAGEPAAAEALAPFAWDRLGRTVAELLKAAAAGAPLPRATDPFAEAIAAARAAFARPLQPA